MDIEIQNMKPGQKFYTMDLAEPRVFTLVKCNYDPTNPDYIEYWAKPIYSRETQKFSLTGTNVGQYKYFRYNGVDRSSFIAGIKLGIEMSKKYMTPREIHKSGFDNPVIVYVESRNRFLQWRRTICNVKK